MTAANRSAEDLASGVAAYLERLRAPGGPGRYRFLERGLTRQGRAAALGPSCLALKVMVMLGRWEGLPEVERRGWIEYIRSFQVDGPVAGELLTDRALVDPVFTAHLRGPAWLGRLFPSRLPSPDWAWTVLAETKQAIASLAEVGGHTAAPYRGLPTEPGPALEYLSSLDWAAPWGAGSRAAHLAVFLDREAPRLVGEDRALACRREVAAFLAGLADPVTGGYFAGATPEHDQLVNGAMKVLSALDWLDEPVHQPERLMDATLARLPEPEGCHLVDAAYVLHRCAAQVDHRAGDVADYCGQLWDMIMAHRQPDGGFSYFLGHSQTSYYDISLGGGPAQSDLHGTTLLTWAAVMILGLLDGLPAGWRPMRP